MNIIDFIESPKLLNDKSLSLAQRVSLKVIYGLPLLSHERPVYAKITGKEGYHIGKEYNEVTYICGRRAGKTDKIASNIALYEACARHHRFSPGQIGVVMVVASEKVRQARIAYNYILSKLEGSPILSKLIKSVTSEEISLHNGVSIQVFPCSVARIRGHSLVAFIGDETAFWKVSGKDVGKDVIDSARPALDFPYSKLVKISTPYMQRGEIYQDFKNYYGKDSDDVIVFRGSTELFNPSYSKQKLLSMQRRQPILYRTEHLAEFRTDLSSMYDPLIIDKAINYDRPIELEPIHNVAYKSFVDVAGGGGKDSYAIAIGHEQEGKVIIDVVRSRNPKFNPDEVTSLFCDLLKSYKIYEVHGDKFSGDWSLNSFAKHGVKYVRSERTKSELYLEAESSFNTEKVDIPDRELAINQLKNLIRKARSGGKDSVDSDESEDEANVIVGVTYLLSKEGQQETGSAYHLGMKSPPESKKYSKDDPSVGRVFCSTSK